MELSLGLAPGDAVEAAEEEDGGGEAEEGGRQRVHVVARGPQRAPRVPRAHLEAASKAL